MRESGLLLLDSDLFVLLAGAGLLPGLIDQAGFDLESARRMQPLPHMLRGKGMVRKYPEAVRQRALAWCSEIAALEQAPPAHWLDQLSAVQAVDPGEALLFALVAGQEESLVATGDKRACSAIARAENLEELQGRLAGKVLCLETILTLLLDRLGYSRLVPALLRVRETNRTLRILLSEGDRTPEETFRGGLGSYLEDLRVQAGSLLFSVK